MKDIYIMATLCQRWLNVILPTLAQPCLLFKQYISTQCLLIYVRFSIIIRYFTLLHTSTYRSIHFPQILYTHLVEWKFMCKFCLNNNDDQNLIILHRLCIKVNIWLNKKIFDFMYEQHNKHRKTFFQHWANVAPTDKTMLAQRRQSRNCDHT